MKKTRIYLCGYWDRGHTFRSYIMQFKSLNKAWEHFNKNDLKVLTINYKGWI